MSVKNRITLLLSLAVIAAVAIPCAASAFPVQAYAANTYGNLCAKYESGNDPACIDPNCAYGAYQMDTYNAKLFASWLKKNSNSTYANWGKALCAACKKDGKKCGSYFDITWKKLAGSTLTKAQKKKLAKVAKAAKLKSVAAGSRSKFLHRQYLYVKEAYYKDALVYWKKVAPGFKSSKYSYALRSAIFSTAVQHGPYGSAYKILKPALKAVGGWKKGMSEKKLINAIYDERSKTATKRVASVAKGAKINKISKTSATAKKYGIAGKYLVHFYSSPGSVQIGVYARLGVSERADALAMYKKYK